MFLVQYDACLFSVVTVSCFFFVLAVIVTEQQFIAFTNLLFLFGPPYILILLE